MNIVLIIVGALLILFGVLIKHARMYSLINGYDSMPSDKRIKFDIKGYAKFLRNCLVILGFFIIVGHLFFKWINWETASWLVVFIAIPILIYLLIIGQKFHGAYPLEKAKRNKRILLSIYSIILVVIVIMITYKYISI